MSSAVVKAAKLPACSARVRTQRTRVLEAAKKCFIESGFHAASMIDIASTADMSVGLIYRYFASKSAIVRAIIDHHIDQAECRIVGRIGSPESLAEGILEVYDCWRGDGDPDLHAALFLEITAEATRDAAIAAAVRKANEFMRSSLIELVHRCARANGVKFDAATVRGRVQVLQCLVEGMAVHAIREPEADRAVLKSALEHCVRALLT